MVKLITSEPSGTLTRTVPTAFAVAQLTAGYTRVQIIDLDTDVILFEATS